MFSKLCLAARPMVAKRCMFAPAQRFVHARGYNTGYDFVYPQHMEVQGAFMHCKNIESFAIAFEYYKERLTDEQIAFAMFFIAEHNLPKEPEFWNVILPRVKEQLKTLDRNAKDSIFTIVMSMGRLQIQDNEFWETVEQKLVDEGLLRYMEIPEVAKIAWALSNVGRGSDKLFDNIESYSIKHRLALTEDDREMLTLGFKNVNKGSEILF